MHTSTPIKGINSGDKAFGAIYATPNESTVVSEWEGQYSNLTVANAGRYWDYADVTLETYSVTSCDQMATGTFVFENLQLFASDGTLLAPEWKNTTIEPSECGGSISASGVTVAISHNL